MRHEHQRRAALAVEAEDQIHHRVRRVAVEVARRFVAEQDLRAVDEGPRERHALLLAAGKLDRIVIESLPQPHPREQGAGVVRMARRASELERHEHVLQRCERRDELEILKHESDGLVAHACAAILIQPAELAAGELHAAGRGLVEAGAEAEQRGLATAGGTDDGAGTARREGEGDLMQDGQGARRGGIGLGQPLDF